MALPLDARERIELPIVIAFADITGYTVRATHTPDTQIADEMDEYYRRVAAAVEPAGGHVVKFIGDAALMAFPADRVDDSVLALLALKRDTEKWLQGIGWGGRLIVKVHVGSVVAGPYGPLGAERFDILGENVNIAATLSTKSFALSAETFRKLSPETRKHFKKHTPPITYIRVEDKHPHRTGRPR